MNALRDFIHRHKKWEPLVFFIGGFTFDAMLLHRIDDPLMLAHQALYLSLSAFLIAWDLLTEAGRVREPSGWWGRVWSYREGVLHFLLGTLLNVYTIFYFKSGTLLSSILFLVVLAALLILNEVRPKKISKHVLRNSLFGLCLISYSNIVVSILVGSIGAFVFLAAVAVALMALLIFVGALKSRLDPARVVREIRLPFLVVALAYSLLYFFKILPPVPMSVKHIGIYREVLKSPEGYHLSYRRPFFWRLWESGEQTFLARPGDRIYCFVQVFSPTRFKEQLFMRWRFRDPKRGWLDADSIPMEVVGGRAEGFRGSTVKSNYEPGDWRVSVETSDGREVGRIGLEIIAVPAETELGPAREIVR